jgi:Tol biopolymer transport system component
MPDLTIAQELLRPVISHIVAVNADGTGEQLVASLDGRWEAPNWAPDGSYLLVNSAGALYRIPFSTGTPEKVFTGPIDNLNNDHGISPDGQWYAISARQIYVIPALGGTPRQVTTESPSYWHGWSPDGQRFAYCGRRDDVYSLFSISVEGGEETRLTWDPAYDDGPEYSADGQWIWFNSNRGGKWSLWRIPASGAGPHDMDAEQMTDDDGEDWFPHASPDGRWVVFLTYEKGIPNHPPNRTVRLRRYDCATGRVETLRSIFGGQGTLNVNSWSPDGQRFAFVRFELK